ncbi:putative mfs sugar transporter protein [Diplogelasinospora grovesii]|uniref:Mfs sugar transporter protein n=1 Tax=Diplogelasinospora grovesii TaxID=303347 RepID=A0AAN6MUJ1_9PEZI|nr:putative mfs sugar transporter protein [Diplogelasinospora grovesii]
MADGDKKTVRVVHHDDVSAAHKLGVDVDEVVVNRITEEDLSKISAESLNLKSWAGFRIMLIIIVMGFNQAGYGIDWAVISNINSFDSWHSFFGFGSSGPVIGTINALMLIGTFVGAPFLSLSDVVGRRGINFIGNLIVVVAALMQGLAPNLPCFMIGRFLLGFGTAMCSSSQYMAEIAPVHLRGRLVGVFGACFQIGSIIMSCAMIGFAEWSGNWMWRVPLILQSVAPIAVCLSIYTLCPESPRYLIMKNRPEEAKKVVARYMTTSGDVDQPIVGLVVQQIEVSLENSRTSFRAAWDYRAFFTKEVRFRTLLLCVYSIFQQWNGGGIISYYISPALDTIGIHRAIDQVGINLGLTAIYFVFTAFGAWLIDIFRRRTLIFAGLISFILCQTAVTITSWQYNVAPTYAAAVLTVLWIFIYQICSASLIATMHNLYPVEVLSLPLRAKGMGFYSMFQGAAGVVQTYGISIGIQQVGYKIWVVYIVYNLIQLIVAYFIFPETSKLSLEEIDNIFETPGANPVKLSLKIQEAKKERERVEREELGNTA